MRLVATADYDDLSRTAAELVIAQIRAKPSSLLVLPTGETPLGLFKGLVAAHRAGAVDFGAARFVTLDEYASIGASDRRRLSSWLRRALLEPLGIAEDQVCAFDPAAGDPATEAGRVEAAIAERGGIDLAVLGIGPNGHLGFNEPGSAFDSRSRLVALTQESIRSNAAYWGTEADVPRSAFTLGMGTLLAARALVLLASGTRKAAILVRATEGPIGPEVPASLLRLHPAATVIADAAALSSMTSA